MASTTIKVKFNKGAMEALRKDPSLRADLVKRAEMVARKASDNGRVEGYKVTDLVLEDPRGAVSVMATGHAAYHNRKNHALLKALEAGK